MAHKIFKKYPNRRLYGPYELNERGHLKTDGAVGYRTEAEVSEAIKAGHTVEIYEQQSRKDITLDILKHIVLGNSSVTWTADQLHKLIRQS